MKEIIPELTSDQKMVIRSLTKHTKHLPDVLNGVYGEKSKGLDGRSKEGKAVVKYLKQLGIKYTTSYNANRGKKKDITLNEGQINFLMSDQIDGDMTALDIARLVFKDVTIESLSTEHRIVLSFLKKERPEIIHKNETAIDSQWKAPLADSRVVSKINKATGETLEDGKLTSENRRRVAKTKTYLKSPRLFSIVNAYTSKDDRELFEDELVRAIWDKDDLTVDELNLYITVCINYVRLGHNQKQLNKLNMMFDEVEDKSELKMSLSESIKTKSTELDNCEKRIDSLLTKLNGNRAKKQESKDKETVNFLAFIHAFQKGEERKRAAIHSKARREKVKQSGEELESFSEYKARILGIHKDDLL